MLRFANFIFISLSFSLYLPIALCAIVIVIISIENNLCPIQLHYTSFDLFLWLFYFDPLCAIPDYIFISIRSHPSIYYSFATCSISNYNPHFFVFHLIINFPSPLCSTLPYISVSRFHCVLFHAVILTFYVTCQLVLFISFNSALFIHFRVVPFHMYMFHNLEFYTNSISHLRHVTFHFPFSISFPLYSPKYVSYPLCSSTSFMPKLCHHTFISRRIRTRHKIYTYMLVIYCSKNFLDIC